MKIRTGFVTNSSSYCSAEVVIDNPVLLEILNKYKNDVEAISIFKIGKTLSYYEDELGRTFAINSPTNLEGVIYSIMDIIADYAYDFGDYGKDAYNSFVAEIKENKEKINKNYTRVLWAYKDDSFGEFDNWGSAKITYEKGVFNYGEYEGDD